MPDETIHCARCDAPICGGCTAAMVEGDQPPRHAEVGGCIAQLRAERDAARAEFREARADASEAGAREHGFIDERDAARAELDRLRAENGAMRPLVARLANCAHDEDCAWMLDASDNDEDEAPLCDCGVVAAQRALAGAAPSAYAARVTALEAVAEAARPLVETVDGRGWLLFECGDSTDALPALDGALAALDATVKT